MEKEKRKGKIIAIIVSIIVIALVALVVLIKTGVIKFNFNNNSNNNESNSENIDTNSNNNEIVYDDENYYNFGSKDLYPVMDQDEEINFYKGTKLVSSYKCTGKKCDIIPFRIEYEKGIIDNIVIIQVCDNDDCDRIDASRSSAFYKSNGNEGSGKVILYNMASGNVIATYDKVFDIKYASETLRLMTYSDGSYQFISADNEINTKFNKDELVLSCYEGCSLYYKSFIEDEEINVIVSKKDNKYGIKNLKTGEVIIDYIYDDITFASDSGYYDKNYFVGRIGEQSNLYKISNGDAVTKNGYEQIHFLYLNILLVLKDNEISVIDMNENRIVDDTIKIHKLNKWMPKNPDGIIIHVGNPETGAVEENNVYVSVSDIVDKKYIDYTYVYHIAEKELKFIEKKERDIVE